MKILTEILAKPHTFDDSITFFSNILKMMDQSVENLKSRIVSKAVNLSEFREQK